MKLVNDEQNDWDEHLPALLFSYRTSIQKTKKLTSFEVMYCQYVIYCLTLYNHESATTIRESEMNFMIMLSQILCDFIFSLF